MVITAVGYGPDNTKVVTERGRSRAMAHTHSRLCAGFDCVLRCAQISYSVAPGVCERWCPECWAAGRWA